MFRIKNNIKQSILLNRSLAIDPTGRTVNTTNTARSDFGNKHHKEEIKIGDIKYLDEGWLSDD